MPTSTNTGRTQRCYLQPEVYTRLPILSALGATHSVAADEFSTALQYPSRSTQFKTREYRYIAIALDVLIDSQPYVIVKFLFIASHTFRNRRCSTHTRRCSCICRRLPLCGAGYRRRLWPAWWNIHRDSKRCSLDTDS